MIIESDPPFLKEDILKRAYVCAGPSSLKLSEKSGAVNNGGDSFRIA